ncbi:hypothetical protein AK830_g3102 [Neonectria ditissima]|uniref:Uncharacterized protein n=1 Tax=Neonectria ditissima TaxID=78410 RepID=A0A0P7B9M8_9HYPO|nr:hypothetical protein AK830_g3102 [Neonectria ditissima]
MLNKPLPDSGTEHGALTTTERQNKSQDQQVRMVGVAHVEHILHDDSNDGLNDDYEMYKVDETFLAPADRALLLRWVADQDPM